MDEEAIGKVQDALIRGDVSAFTSLIERHNLTHWISDASAPDYPFPLPILHLAVLHGHVALVEYLLDQYPDHISIRDDSGDVCMAYACLHGHIELIRIITQKDKEQLTARNEEGMLSIHHACMEGRLEVVKVLLQLDPELIDAMTRTDVPLRLPEEQDARGLPPLATPEDNLLHLACESGNFELVTWLCQQRLHALWTVRGRMADLPWERALCYGHEDLALMLMNHQIDHMELTDISCALLSVLEGSHDFAQQVVNHPTCQKLLQGMHRLNQSVMVHLTHLCFSAMAQDRVETFLLIWSHVPWKDGNFPLLKHAIFENELNMVKYLWDHPSQARVRQKLQSRPIRINRLNRIAPELAVLLLLSMVNIPSYVRWEHTVYLIKQTQDASVVRALYDDEWEDALTRLLGSVPDFMEEHWEMMEEAREDQDLEMSEEVSKSIAETPQSTKEFCEFFFYRHDLFLSEDMMSKIDIALENQNQVFAIWAMEQLKKEIIMKALENPFSANDLKLSVRAAETNDAQVLQYLFEHYPHEAVIAGGAALYMATAADEEAAGHVLLQYLPEQQLNAAALQICMDDDPSEYSTPIDAACYYGWNVGHIRKMLEYTGPRVLYPLEGDADDRRYPLLSVAIYGNLPLFDLLIEIGGTDQFTKTVKRGYSVLHAICGNMHEELGHLPALSDDKIIMAKRVLEVAPELERTRAENLNSYPIQMACADGLYELVRFLIQRPASRTLLNGSEGPLQRHCDRPHVTQVILPYLELHHLFHIDKKGRTALHSVARTRNPELVKYVLNHVGHHPHIVYSQYEGLTCLDLAIFHGLNDEATLETVQLLVECMYPSIILLHKNNETHGGFTPFSQACVGLPRVVEYFLDLLPQRLMLTDDLLNVFRHPPNPHETRVRAEILTILLQREVLSESLVRQVANPSTMAMVLEMIANSRTKSARSSHLGKRARSPQ